MIKIENLNFKFDNDVIFQNADIEIPKGKITVILGTNGAGKSTLLKIITKNLKADCTIQKKDLNLENLSAGEFQKANIALGLLSCSDLFLLDEPVSNMDLINEIKIFDTLRKLLHKKRGDGVTSVLIMHDINLAANFGDYFIGIKKADSCNRGKVIQASKDEFFTKENLKEIYGIDFEILKTNGKFYIQIVN